MDPVTAFTNLSRKAAVRLFSAHKPVVRALRRRTRAAERDAITTSALAVEAEIARVAASGGPIVAGPWLGEVGYEALYWLPFLRWVQDRFRIPSDRLIAVSRGGVEHWYEGLASRYVDLFDVVTPGELAARNEARQAREEGGGRKQSRRGELDDWLLTQAALDGGAVLHPSLMFRLFRDVWQGNLALDFLFTRTHFTRVRTPPRPSFAGLPAEYIAAKFYTGTALPQTGENLEALRSVVRNVARRVPVVMLETGMAVDEHRDYEFDGIPGVTSAREWMTPRTNLGVQSALVAHARYFLGTCGGLAWLAPFMGVPAVAVYDDDALLRPHLTIARLAGERVRAAEFASLDLRALRRIDAGQLC
ncbi:MAG: hypothetical protein A3F70_00730 [Acidobacteria bacterium RIFCSPLOWO2_12_FULL_67_14]|nr:MAG: hypothetical protein A3H29_10395 [Acidobacteria bacterium RIFCSPLOWO2_02_FULL_67_21]OFW36136.1 MAG: hypothetical protein A3F70_00730 [Acidobacteria bacterium RIFCSPLOWO2_12_FULL_67_14]